MKRRCFAASACAHRQENRGHNRSLNDLVHCSYDCDKSVCRHPKCFLRLCAHTAEHNVQATLDSYGDAADSIISSLSSWATISLGDSYDAACERLDQLMSLPDSAHDDPVNFWQEACRRCNYRLGPMAYRHEKKLYCESCARIIQQDLSGMELIRLWNDR